MHRLKCLTWSLWRTCQRCQRQDKEKKSCQDQSYILSWVWCNCCITKQGGLVVIFSPAYAVKVDTLRTDNLIVRLNIGNYLSMWVLIDPMLMYHSYMGMPFTKWVLCYQRLTRFIQIEVLQNNCPWHWEPSNSLWKGERKIMTMYILKKPFPY